MDERPIRLLVYAEAGEVAVAAESLLSALGLDTEAKQHAVFGDGCRLEEIAIRPPLRAYVREVERQCLVPDAALGFRYEAHLEPQKRAAVFLQAWTLEAFGSPYEEAFLRLPPALAEAIDAEIRARLRPSATWDRFYWQRVEQSAVRIRSGEPICYGALPEGVKAYYHWRKGWPLPAACLDAMHAEDAETFLFCLHLEAATAQQAEAADEEVRAAAEATVETVRQRLGMRA